MRSFGISLKFQIMCFSDIWTFIFCTFGRAAAPFAPPGSGPVYAAYLPAFNCPTAGKGLVHHHHHTSKGCTVTCGSVVSKSPCQSNAILS